VTAFVATGWVHVSAASSTDGGGRVVQIQLLGFLSISACLPRDEGGVSLQSSLKVTHGEVWIDSRPSKEVEHDSALFDKGVPEERGRKRSLLHNHMAETFLHILTDTLAVF